MTDIARERSLLRKQGLAFRTRQQWGATFDYTNDRDVTTPAVAFFLHIAVVDDPGDLIGTEDQVARNIERIGISRFPNTGISYNALAFNTGRLYEAQPLTRRGAHTVNDKRLIKCPTHGGSLAAPSWNNNVNARALCLPQQVGDDVTDEQIDAAAQWAAAQVRSGLAVRGARWHGHRCVAAKGCPGDEAFDRIPELQELTEKYVREGLLPPKRTVRRLDVVVGVNLFVHNADPIAAIRNIVDAVRRAGWKAPDVIAPQEGQAMLDELAHVPGYRLFYASPRDGQGGVSGREIPLLFRRRLKVYELRFIPGARGKGDGRNRWHRGIVIGEWRGRLTRRRRRAIVNTHLPLDVAGRAHQTAQIVGEVTRLREAGRLVTVCADANGPELAEALREIGMRVTVRGVDLVATDPKVTARVGKPLTIDRSVTGSDTHDGIAVRTERKS